MTAPLFQHEVKSYVRDDGITVFQRMAFCEEHFPYKKGEHAVFGGPSTRGKTTMAFDLLQYVAKPSFPAYVAVSKPRDAVTSQRSTELGFRRVSDWPPTPKLGEMKAFGGQKPPGYVIWPPFGDLDTDMQRCSDITSRLLMERYANGVNPKSMGGVLVLDDTMVKAKIMGLDNQMVTILAMAGAMDLGEWVFIQKPTDSGRVTVWAYEQATHLFFTKGGDDQMLKRYQEIAGDQGKIVRSVVPTLKPYQFLYIHKYEGYTCIVDAK